MQPLETHCPKCNSEMESGFLVDIIFPGTAVLEPQGESLSWAKGSRSQVPKAGWLSRFVNGIGFLLSSVERKPVTSLRCVRCGYVELYAR